MPQKLVNAAAEPSSEAACAPTFVTSNQSAPSMKITDWPGAMLGTPFNAIALANEFELSSTR